MSKVAIGISLDLDDIELIDEIVRSYHQKSRAQAIHTIIKQWQMYAEERTKQRELIKENKKKQPSNPMVNL
jgi:metal-responsive CopG/Arc/MetJ family transcriptional regulator